MYETQHHFLVRNRKWYNKELHTDENSSYNTYIKIGIQNLENASMVDKDVANQKKIRKVNKCSVVVWNRKLDSSMQ